MKLFFYSLTVNQYPSGVGAGVSCHLQPNSYYFATQAKLDLWRKRNPDLEKDALFAMHEIDLATVRALIKLSKKKIKQKCQECGR